MMLVGIVHFSSGVAFSRGCLLQSSFLLGRDEDRW